MFSFSGLSKLYQRSRLPFIYPLVLLGALLANPLALRALDWSTLFTAQDVRDHLSTDQGRADALDFCRKLGISKVYVEAFRDGYQPDEQTLKTARDFFRQAGLRVSGCVTTTGIGKTSSGWHVAVCYTNRKNQERLASIFRFAAGIFDEIMIDDFFFTDCECSECAAAKGSMRWPQYREKLMLEMARERVLGPAKQVNPNVKVILKYPQWYDNFQERGYIVDKETELFDRIWVGTELRDPSSDEWGHKQQYTGYFIYRWFRDIGAEKTGGGWFDPFGTNAVTYLDQALITVLAGAPEAFLFHYGSLASSQYKEQVEALAAHRAEYEALSKLVGNWTGIPAYKPVSSEPGDEPYLFDQIGMLAIPLAPTAHFPEKARAALFTLHSLKDVEFVPRLTSFLNSGGTALVSESLAHALTADPRLPSAAPTTLPKNKYLFEVQEGNGKLVIFSDSLPRLAYVDSNNRVAQISEAQREALAELRKIVEEFTVTSPDAPPRVAVFPMGARAAVANFTELPVACRIVGLGGMVSRLRKVQAIDGASLASDGNTLRLPPHAAIVVEQ
ncbi:MAG: hypothetical protein ABSF46_14220 [Terriglobia bacterium]